MIICDNERILADLDLSIRMDIRQDSLLQPLQPEFTFGMVNGSDMGPTILITWCGWMAHCICRISDWQLDLAHSACAPSMFVVLNAILCGQ